MTQSEIIKAIEVLTKVIEVNAYAGDVAAMASEKIERLIPMLDKSKFSDDSIKLLKDKQAKLEREPGYYFVKYQYMTHWTIVEYCNDGMWRMIGCEGASKKINAEIDECLITRKQ